MRGKKTATENTESSSAQLRIVSKERLIVSNKERELSPDNHKEETQGSGWRQALVFQSPAPPTSAVLNLPKQFLRRTMTPHETSNGMARTACYKGIMELCFPRPRCSA